MTCTIGIRSGSHGLGAYPPGHWAIRIRLKLECSHWTTWHSPVNTLGLLCLWQCLILSLPTCWSVCGSDLLRSNKVELKIVLLAFLWAIASKQLGHYSKIGGVNEKKKKMRSIISATNLVETLTLRRRRRGQARGQARGSRASSRLRMEIQTGLSITHLFSFVAFENFTLWKKTINRLTGIGISNLYSLN